MLFCIILHMKLFTKETLTHTSLYQLKVTHRDRGKLEGRGGRGDFFLFVFLFLLECALLTRSSKEGKSQPDRQTEKERERERVEKQGRLQVSTLNKRHWLAPPPQLEQLTNSSAQSWAQTLHKAMLELKQYFNTF